MAKKTSVSSLNPADVINIFGYRISEWTPMSISEPFQYRNDSFQSDIFSSDIGITDVDVGYHRY
jgi:hypothetical protein